MAKKDFNEVLKAREERERQENARRAGEAGMTLDDAARVKVLSPGMLVFKRFIRNKLAIVGSVILICMFLFSFLGPYFYRYGQTEVFSKYSTMNADYASAKERTEYVLYTLQETDAVSSTAKNLMNSVIAEMEAAEKALNVSIDDKTGSVLIVETQTCAELNDTLCLGKQENSEASKNTIKIGIPIRFITLISII